MGRVGHAHHRLLSLSVAHFGFQSSGAEEASLRGRTSMLPSLSPIPIFDIVAMMMPFCILLFSFSTSLAICITFTWIHKYYSAQYYTITIHLHIIPSMDFEKFIYFPIFDVLDHFLIISDSMINMLLYLQCSYLGFFLKIIFQKWENLIKE